MSDPATAPRDTAVLIPLSLLTLYLVWGSTYLAIRWALESYPPFLLAGVRFLFAGVALYAFLRWRGLVAPTMRQWRNAGITGVLLLGFGNGLVCFAEERVSSGIAAVATSYAYVTPPVAVLFGLLLAGETVGPRDLAGMAIILAGVAVITLWRSKMRA